MENDNWSPCYTVCYLQFNTRISFDRLQGSFINYIWIHIRKWPPITHKGFFWGQIRLKSQINLPTGSFESTREPLTSERDKPNRHQEIEVWINNYIITIIRDTIIYPCPNFNDSLLITRQWNHDPSWYLGHYLWIGLQRCHLFHCYDIWNTDKQPQS